MPNAPQNWAPSLGLDSNDVGTMQRLLSFAQEAVQDVSSNDGHRSLGHTTEALDDDEGNDDHSFNAVPKRF